MKNKLNEAILYLRVAKSDVETIQRSYVSTDIDMALLRLTDVLSFLNDAKIDMERKENEKTTYIITSTNEL